MTFFAVVGGGTELAVRATPLGAALQRFEEGSRHFAAGRFDAALRAFQASMELEPSPNTRFKIAKCYVALGKTASAYVNFKRTAQEAQDRANATGEKRYIPTRDAALTEANALENKVPKLTLAVPSDIPEGFSISLDGSVLPQSAWGLAVETDPGPHTVLAVGPRVKRYSQIFELHPGEFKRLDVPVVRVATATIRLVFEAKPVGLAVSIDGQPVSPDQFDKPYFVDVGNHKVTVHAPGYSTFNWRKTLGDNDSVSVPIMLDAQSGVGVPKLAVFITGGAALAALAVGIGFGVKAKLAANQELALDPLQRSPVIQDGIRTDAIIANVFYGVSGALGVTAAILASTVKWRERKPLKSSSVFLRAESSVARNGASLSVAGGF
ncbi:MAG: PEGA domain-containing protein [Polyangia bacterium]